MLQIEAAGVARKRLRGVEVSAEQRLELGDVPLENAAKIRGVLVAGADLSPEGYTVYLGQHLGRQVEIEGVDGAFEFDGLEAGSYRLSWSRPSQDMWLDPNPRGQTFDLAAGEVRDVVLDASASAPCTVVVRLVRAGKPAAGLRVFYGVRSQENRAQWSGTTLGTTSADGMVVGQVDGDLTFDLRAYGEGGWSPIGTIATDLAASPGGRIERTFELSVGRLVLELPEGLQAPEKGRVGVTLAAAGRERIFLGATTAGVTARMPDSTTWTGRTIDLGELEAGEYEATIRIERYEDSGVAQQPPQVIALREPYTTQVTIEPERTATITVP